MMGGNILVTGANGQVGRACTAGLRQAGFHVVAVSRDGSGGGPAVDLSLPFEQGLARLGERYPDLPHTIVHLAAAVPHDPRYPDDARSADITRAIDRHVYQAARAWETRVVYMSSCALYDRTDPAVKAPQSPLARHMSPYAAAKRAGELLFAEHDAAILRLSAPAGAYSRPNLVFGRFAERCRAGLPIELWGKGRREQDFIHLDDVCALLLSAIQSSTGGIYNCASGRAVTMLELAEAMTRFYGRGSISYAEQADPLEGETARYAIERTQQAFNWSPKQGLAEMMASLEDSRNEDGLPALGAVGDAKGQ